MLVGSARQHEHTTLFPEETRFRKSRKAQSNEIFCRQGTGITWEEKQRREQENAQQRTKEMQSWELDRSFASASQNKALI